MTIKITPCKYCKRGRIRITNQNKIGSQITADKCVYCGGKGWIRVDIAKEETKENSNI